MRFWLKKNDWIKLLDAHCLQATGGKQRKTKTHSHSTNNLTRNILAEPCLTWFLNTFTVYCSLFSIQFLLSSEAFQSWDLESKELQYTSMLYRWREKWKQRKIFGSRISKRHDMTQADRIGIESKRKWRKSSILFIEMQHFHLQQWNIANIFQELHTAHSIERIEQLNVRLKRHKRRQNIFHIFIYRHWNVGSTKKKYYEKMKEKRIHYLIVSFH